MSNDLNSDNAFIFRIVHKDNFEWIVKNGLHCRNSTVFDPNYVNIGNVELIDRRSHRFVDFKKRTTLSDYVPFYFTPFSPMMMNIHSGRGGVVKRNNEEIIILVSSLYKLKEKGVSFLFTDRHAYLDAAEFFTDIEDLNKIDWKILQERDFKRDEEDPGKFERYQAEALVHNHVPLDALLGVACYNQAG